MTVKMWRDSARELRSTRALVVTALFLAVKIAMDMALSVPIPPNLRITFGFLAIGAIGMLYGPVPAALGAAAADVLSYLIANNMGGGYFPGYTLSAALGGALYGAFFYGKAPCLWRAAAAKGAVNLFVNIGLNTLWLTLTGGSAFFALLPLRALKNGLLLLAEVPMLLLVWPFIRRISRRL